MLTRELVGILGIGGLLALIIAGVPIAFSFIIVASAGLLYLESVGVVLSTFQTIPYRWAASYELSCIVLFILMATFASHSGLAEVLYDAANKWLGKIRGSLAMATVVACGAFATISGSSIATAGAMGKIVLPEMKKLKYDERLAAGCAAAGGTLGILIPPSISFVIYAVLVEASIGALFMAGIFPGLMEIISYMLVIALLLRIFPGWAPIGLSCSIKAKLSSLALVWPVALVAVVVLGGIYMGVFTPTEAGGIGVTATFLILLSTRRMSRKIFFGSLAEAGKLTCAIYLIIIGAMVFNRFLAIAGTMDLIGRQAELFGTPITFLLFVMLVYFILGMFMDPMAMIILTIPIFLPIISKLGISFIWYGVICVRMMEVGMITPPVGLNLFTIHAVNPDVPSLQIIKGAIPFVIADIICIAILIVFPQISLWLPSTMMKKR